MTKKNNQVLLPPVSEEPVGLRAWIEWLTDPLPGRFVLPATGLLVMGLDWVLFSKEAATLGLAIPFTSTVGFVAGGVGAYFLQRKFGLDAKPAAVLKGLIAGVLVAVPFPLAGTAAGALILATSGLAGLKTRFIKDRLFRKA